MGGARAFVAVSTSWPAWSCSVSNSGSLEMKRGMNHTKKPYDEVVRTCIGLRSSRRRVRSVVVTVRSNDKSLRELYMSLTPRDRST
jgi:hypothetical protein